VVAEVRRATGVRFAPLGAVCLQAMLDGDLPAASTIARSLTTDWPTIPRPATSRRTDGATSGHGGAVRSSSGSIPVRVAMSSERRARGGRGTRHRCSRP